MKKSILLLAASFLVSLSISVTVSASPMGDVQINVVPQPVRIDYGSGSYQLTDEIGVKQADKVSAKLAAEVVRAFDISGKKAYAVKKHEAVRVSFRPGMAQEEYRIAVSTDGISVEASDVKGAYNAVQTLVQMMDAATDGKLPVCGITDYPRFPYRGLMLDVVRCYVPVKEIKKFVDIASRLKINNVHLHLTDDNGWRMEIKKYPRLTEVGAWRVDRPELFPGRLNQLSADEPTPIGGFYTQEELRDLVKYAADRNINIIPEIEMPAHAAAAIASYPELACPVNDKFVGVFPGIGGKDASIIMCAGNDKVYEFYKDVLDEVMEVFPSQLINLGGDEANKALWKKCPLCQERIRKEGLAGFEELQGYFMDEINSYVRKNGRTAMGWDEVTYGNPKEDIVVIGWQGQGKTAVDYSRRTGRKFIMTPALKTYLIRYQGPQWFEPWTYFGNNRLTDIYHYEPVESDWTPQLEDSMIGVQGSLWSEFCKDASDMQYLVFPRLLAVADIAWTPKGSKDYARFLERVDSFLPTLTKAGIKYAHSMWNIQHTLTPNGDGTVKVELECERPDAKVRYSLADSVMDREYAVFSLAEPAVVYASTFADGLQKGKTLRVPVDFNYATGRSVISSNCNNGLQSRLTNGVRGSLRNSDFEWAGWYNRPVEFTVDLGGIRDIDSVKLGTLINSDICVLAPDEVTLAISEDGEKFTTVAVVLLEVAMSESHPARILDIDFGNITGTKARYIKINAVNAGPIPDGMAREGVPTWIYFDELIVK